MMSRGRNYKKKKKTGDFYLLWYYIFLTQNY